MLPSTKRQPVTSQRFQLLVGHYESSSDPSKGEAGNPTLIRHGFMTQVVQNSLGTASLGTVQSERASLVIKVNSTEYGNSAVVAAPPFYDYDTIQVYTDGLTDGPGLPELKAGVDFGFTAGGGLGLVADVALELARAINRYGNGIHSYVDPGDNTRVIVRTESPSDGIVVNIKSVNFNLFTGAPPFLVLDLDGNELFNPVVSGKANARIIKKVSGLQPMIELK